MLLLLFSSGFFEHLSFNLLYFCRTLRSFVGGEVNLSLLGQVVLSFLINFCGSIALGLFVGLTSAYV
jgi:NhaP-type Na+/H+ or K+/H+ antiporter